MKLAQRLVLLAAAIIIPITVGLLTLATLDDNPPAEVGDNTDCAGADLRDAGIRMNVSLDDGGRDYPRLTTVLRIAIPVSQPLAIHLEESRDSVAFKSAVQCLLNTNGSYNDELRDRVPRITEDGSNVVFEDAEHTDVTGPGPVNLGMVSLTPAIGDDWLLQASPAPVLASAGSSDFIFETPDGTAHDARPWPPAKITGTQIVWSSRNHDAATGYFVHVQLSARNTFALSAGGGAANIVATCFYWLDTAFIPLLLLGYLVALRRKGYLRDEDSDTLRFIVPTCLLCVTMFAYALMQTVVPSGWNTLYIIAAAVTVTIAGVSAWIWHAQRAVIVILLVVAYVAIGIVIVAWTPLINGDAVFRKTVCAAWAAYSCALAALIVVGVFESMRRLLSPSSTHRSVVTIAALAVAAVLTAERVALDLYYYRQQEWLDTAPGWSMHLAENLPAVSYTMLSQLIWLIQVVPVVCLWRIQATLGEYSAERPTVRAIGGAILVYTVLNWDISTSGWSFPMAIPSAVCVWLLLSRFRYLSAQATRDQTIADVVRNKSVSELREDVRVWQIEYQGRLVRERALTSTTQGMAAFGAWAAHLGTAPGDRAQSAFGPRFRNVLRRITGQTTPPITSQPMDGINPMEILLAVGPSKSPAENSAQALRLSVVVTVPAAAFMTWLWMRYAHPQLPSVTDNAICNVLSEYVWTLLQYTFGAAAVGLLWHYLPGRRGIVKVLPVAALYAVLPLLKFIVPTIVGGHVGMTLLSDALVFFAILMYVGVAMDAVNLRGPGTVWTAPGRILLSAYGMQNFTTQVTFVAANIGAVITIWNLIHGNPEGGHTHDPSVLNKSGGTSSR